jgi:hypothetical protein
LERPKPKESRPAWTGQGRKKIEEQKGIGQTEKEKEGEESFARNF